MYDHRFIRALIDQRVDELRRSAVSRAPRAHTASAHPAGVARRGRRPKRRLRPTPTASHH